MEALDPRLHFVVATAIIIRNREVSDAERSRSIKIPEFLIAKRAPHEKAFPNKWTPLEVVTAAHRSDLRSRLSPC